jgi:hypothetical protein
MKQYSKYVGMDVHKEEIMISVAAAGNGEAWQQQAMERQRTMGRYKTILRQ